MWSMKLYNIEIWIEEMLTLSKARRVITGFILLLKYQKQTMAAVSVGKIPHMLFHLLPLEGSGYTKCCPLMSV